MIVKSLSRKAPTFRQLIAYIDRDSSGQPFARNLYHPGPDRAAVADQFIANWRHLPERKNGNALYHEVIVLEQQPRLSKARLAEILHSLAEQYCALRGPDQLAWGHIHFDTPQPHIHLMLSANAAGSKKRARLTSKDYHQVLKDLEVWQRQNFSELADRPLHQAARSGPKKTRAEGERERRTGQPSRKQELALRLAPIIAAAKSADDLKARVKPLGLDLYRRGQSYGVIDATGRRHRLKTLGLEPTFVRSPDKSAPQRNSANPPQDRRAADLIRRRQAMQDLAQDRLRGFDDGDRSR